MGVDSSLPGGTSLPGGPSVPSDQNVPVSSQNVPSSVASPPPGSTVPNTAPIAVTFVPSGLRTIVATQLSPEQFSQIMQQLPSLLSGMSLDEQNQFLQLLLSSDILNALFGNLDQPETHNAFNSIVNSLFQNGLLSQLPSSTGSLPSNAQDAMQEQITQNVAQTLQNMPTGGDLSIPISPPGTANAMPETIALLVATSITSAMQQIAASGAMDQGASTSGGKASATPQQAPASPQIEPQNTPQNLLTSLITLQLMSAPGGVVQIGIPPKMDSKMDPSGFPNAVATLTQQVNLISQQFSKLGEMVSQEQWDIGPLQNFLTVPPTILALLKNIEPGDMATFNFLKTWVDNSEVVQNAILARANQTYSDKFEFLKTIISSSTLALPVPLLKEQQMRQQLFDQLLLAAPALLNIFKLKDIVGGFEDSVKRQHAALLYAFKRMLYNAANEITIVASGKRTFEYNEVGVFHETLPLLAQKIEVMLPPSSQDLSFEKMELIANDITHTFKFIKENEPHRLNEILKRHPRTLLYFLSTRSPVTAEISFPITSSLGPIPDSTILTAHLARILNVVKQFEKQSEFLKFQPKVLEAFVDEAKYDPAGDITKNSLHIIHKAIAESSGFIDLDSD